MPRKPPLRERVLTALDEGEGTAFDLHARIVGPNRTFWQELFGLSLGSVWFALLDLIDQGLVTCRVEDRPGDRYSRRVWRKVDRDA